MVGVAGDVRGYGLDQPPVEAVYFPLVENHGMGVARGPQVVVRVEGTHSTTLVPTIRRALSKDFSWDRAARAYARLYETARRRAP